jgi:hypothetical protein
MSETARVPCYLQKAGGRFQHISSCWLGLYAARVCVELAINCTANTLTKSQSKSEVYEGIPLPAMDISYQASTKETTRTITTKDYRSRWHWVGCNCTPGPLYLFPCVFTTKPIKDKTGA